MWHSIILKLHDVEIFKESRPTPLLYSRYAGESQLCGLSCEHQTADFHVFKLTFECYLWWAKGQRLANIYPYTIHIASITYALISGELVDM